LLFGNVSISFLANFHQSHLLTEWFVQWWGQFH